MTDRIQAIRKNVVRDRYEVVTTNYELFTKAWQEADGEPDVIRTAKARAYVLDNIPIFILPGELIPVAPASKPLALEADFCWRGCWGEVGIATLKDPSNWCFCTDETADSMRRLSAYWHRYAPDYKIYKLYDKQLAAYKRSGFALPRCLDMEEAAGNGLAVSCLSVFPDQEYTNVDYGYVMGKGLQAIIDEAKVALANEKNADVHSALDLKRSYSRQAMIIINEAVIRWIGRYADLAEKMAASEEDPGRKSELLDIADTCRRIPAQPAKTFLDALTFQWLILVLINGMNTTPIGRIDQYTYPYWKADMEAGRIDEAKTIEMIQSFRLKYMQIKSTTGGAHAQKWSGQANWRGMTLGGVDSQGNDATNELSYLFLEAAKDCQTPFPTISLRVHEGTPKELMRKAMELVTAGLGYPSFVGDKSYIAFLTDKEVPIERARQYYITGCVDVNGPETYSELFATTTTALPLDSFLHRGWGPVHGEQIAPDSGDPREMKTFDEFFEKFVEHNRYYYQCYATEHTMKAMSHSGFMEDVFTVSLYSDGVKQGLPWFDRKHPYKTGPVIGIGVGTINMAQSLAVIKKLVYDEKKLTMDELISALDANWEGERNQEIRRMCLEVPRYGNNCPETDAMVTRVYNALCDLVQSVKNYRGISFNPGALSITAHEPGGRIIGATPDGRYSQSVLADGAVSPIQGDDRSGPTSAFLSALSVPHERLTSALFNMKFAPSALKTEADVDKLIAAVHVYFANGGKQIQFNVVDDKQLKAAQQKPEEYKNLIVRVAGYSTYFTILSPSIQNEIISRTAQAF